MTRFSKIQIVIHMKQHILFTIVHNIPRYTLHRALARNEEKQFKIAIMPYHHWGSVEC